jgi:two-component system, OmpR family, response regulator
VADIRQIGEGKKQDERKPIRVLLLDDLEDNLLLRATILRQNGYEVVSTSRIEDAEAKLRDIDIAVLDYHLGAGQFGTEVADTLRKKRPEVPIIIMSATLERRFGGIADIHLLKGYSSVNDLLTALHTFEAKRRGKPVVFEILDRDGNFEYVNDYFASFFERKRSWFVGKNMFGQFPELGDGWKEVIRTVADTHETYIDRGFRGLPQLPTRSSRWQWNVLVFSLKLHDGRDGVALTARMIEKKGL